MKHLSASGARIRGDDYQHLVAWLQVLRFLLPGHGIASVGIEDPAAGNVDDVTVYHVDGSREFFQAKSSVDAREVVSIEWLMSPSRAGGASILQGFFEVWSAGSSSLSTKLTLITNRPPAASDPVVVLRDGRDGTVSDRLKRASGQSKVGQARGELAKHLKTDEAILLAFLSDLRLIVSRLYEELKEKAYLLMYAAGLRYDEEALMLGLSTVRAWVTEGKRRLSEKEVRHRLEALKRPGEMPAASLLIQAIDRDPMPESATITLDWTSLFQGSEPRTRRRPAEDGLWNNMFRPELQEAARSLRAQGQTFILVRGYMRLPSWFTVGVELGRTAGFEVVSFQQGVPWASAGDLGEFPIMTVERQVGSGKDLGLGVCLAADLSEDALRFLESSVPNAGTLISIFPERGPSGAALGNGSEARAWAVNTRDLVRTLARTHRDATVHLFLAVPHGAALLLGHLWDRVPLTQLYEDLGAGHGYSPSFLIPN
jgi:hypothetical protein